MIRLRRATPITIELLCLLAALLASPSVVNAQSPGVTTPVVAPSPAVVAPSPRVAAPVVAPSPGVAAPMVAGSPSPAPRVEDLGNQRYRVGTIELDKRAGRFTVPGTILRRQPPLEFLAITKGGYKAYESLIEIDTSAHEFNLACILIGLDASQAKPSRSHFDPAPAEGDPVEVSVSWSVKGKTKRVDAADLIRLGDHSLPRGDWRYTGSVVAPNGRYMAQADGTLIGFVHDPATIIEHRTGLLRNYAGVTADAELVPPVGTRIMLTVARPRQPSPTKSPKP